MFTPKCLKVNNWSKDFLPKDIQSNILDTMIFLDLFRQT